MNIQQINEKIKKLNKQKAEILAKQEAEKNKVNTLIIDGFEYETKTHDFNKCLKDIIIPKGWRLWTMAECIKLHNNPNYRKILELEDCWFFIKQPFEFNKEKGSVARFDANSGVAYLNCSWSPDDHDAGLGVRFVRKVKSQKQDKKQ